VTEPVTVHGAWYSADLLAVAMRIGLAFSAKRTCCGGPGAGRPPGSAAVRSTITSCELNAAASSASISLPPFEAKPCVSIHCPPISKIVPEV